MTDESEDEGDAGPPFPWPVRVAGWLWVAQGGLVLAFGVVVGFLAATGPDAVLACVLWVLAAVGGRVLWFGWDVLIGAPEGVGRPAGLAAVVALAIVVGGAACVTVRQAREAGLFLVGVGVAFGLPAVLAFAGRRQYRLWWERRNPPYPPGT